MRRIPCSFSIYYAASRFPSKYVLRMGVTLDGDGDAIRRILAAYFSHGYTGGVMERGIVIGVGNLGCAAIRNLPDDPQMFRAFIAIHHTDYKIGRAHVCTPVTNAHLVCSLLLEKNKHYTP